MYDYIRLVEKGLDTYWFLEQMKSTSRNLEPVSIVAFCLDAGNDEKELSTGAETTTFQEIIDRLNQASVHDSKHGELTSIILNPLIKTVHKVLVATQTWVTEGQKIGRAKVNGSWKNSKTQIRVGLRKMYESPIYTKVVYPRAFGHCFMQRMFSIATVIPTELQIWSAI